MQKSGEQKRSEEERSEVAMAEEAPGPPHVLWVSGPAVPGWAAGGPGKPAGRGLLSSWGTGHAPGHPAGRPARGLHLVDLIRSTWR